MIAKKVGTLAMAVICMAALLGSAVAQAQPPVPVPTYAWRFTQDNLQNTYDACKEGACNFQP